MLGREAALAKSQCEALRRISKDWVDVASSLEGEDVARSVRDLNHPPSMKKTARTVGIALAVAPEPFTTVAGVALVAGSFVMKGEPMAMDNVAEELGDNLSEISAFDLGALTISFP
jgi:hypothetical protein